MQGVQYGSVDESGIPMMSIPKEEYQQLQQQVSAAKAAAIRAEAAVLKMNHLTPKAKCIRVLGAMACLGLVGAVAFLIYQSSTSDTGERISDPCLGKAEGVDTSDLPTQVTVYTGHAVNALGGRMVRFCDAAGHQFSELARVCVQLRNFGDSVAIRLSAPCWYSVEAAQAAFRNATATAISLGNSTFEWLIQIIDSDRTIFTARHVITYVAKEAAKMLRTGLSLKVGDAAISDMGAALYHTASVVGENLQSLASTASEWGAWALGYDN